MAGPRAAAALLLCAAGARGLDLAPKWGDKIQNKWGDKIQSDWSAGGAWPRRAKKNVTVILNGEPKSGTTWLEYVAKELLTEAAKQRGSRLVQNPDGRTVSAQMATGLVAYDIETKHMIPHVGHLNKFDFSVPPTLTDDEIEAAARSTLADAHGSAKWLAIFRDPRDVTISSCYHMFKNCPNPNGYVSSKVGSITQWINLRYRLFAALRKLAPDRVMMLFYEDMKRDEQGTVRRLAEYFGLSLKRSQGQLIAQHTTFSAMKEKPKNEVAQGGAASGKVREGASCAYAKELSPDAAERVTKAMRVVLNKELNAIWKC